VVQATPTPGGAGTQAGAEAAQLTLM